MPDFKNPLDITWAQFEMCNPDTRTAFESMCRFLFNTTFFNGKGLFHSNPNNPGVEILPILYEESGQRISFQAKYFSVLDYSQIKHSAEMAIKHYAGKLDVIYLYCNKDVTTSSDSYQNIEKLLNTQKISLVPITNQTILDQVLSNDTVAWYYFDYYRFTPIWFEDHLRLSLASLGPRYNGDFNVNTHTENQLDIFLCDYSAVIQINQLKRELVEDLMHSRYRYTSCADSLSKIISTISSIDDVTRTTIIDCLSWGDILSEQCLDEFSLISDLISKKRELYAKTDDYKSQNNLSIEIHNLEELMDTPKRLSVDTLNSTLLKEKFLIVRGEAGVGKSQLLANAAEKLNKEGQYALLMLGNNFLTSEPITTQIMQQLDFNSDFQGLLHKLEMLGAQSECYVCLLIDAVNESPYRDIWKPGLQTLTRQISKFDHIKVVISVRTGYERLVFNDAIMDGIKAKTIASIVHSGFREESVDATLAFLNYYGIPFLPSYFLQAEMTNPLFLTLFCKYYTGENFDMFSLFDRLIYRADEEAQKAVGIADPVPILQYLVEELASNRLAKNNWYITRPELFELRFWDAYGLTTSKIPFVAALERSGFLNSVVIEETESYYLGYNLLEDFICAKQILKRYQDQRNELISYIQSDLLDIKNGQIGNYSNVDIVIVLCSLYAERFHKECFTAISGPVTDENDLYDISRRYIESFLWRKASAINAAEFIEYINEHNVPKSSVLRVFIENSTKENHPLNAMLLHDILMNKSLAHRDYLWTTFINGLAHEEERLYQLITYFDEGHTLNGLSQLNIELLLILFTWLLTSSNRFLRDKASKAAIELLKNNFSLCQPLLQRFENVNDPYIIQRLLGIVFGACVKRSTPAMEIYRKLAEYVYNIVFNQEIVYPDILLRDYARLILERWIYEAPSDCDFIDRAKITPPYHSPEIPVAEAQEYFTKKFEHSGFNRIASSMNINHAGCPGMYGDFGRYTFQSALEKFDAINIVNLYHYAMQYIRDTLGYSDELFGDYDTSGIRHSYSRHENKKTERIGKKYQWIAFYNILARTSDTHQLKDWNAPTYPYKGAWEPYIRDFDPTLNENFLKPDFLPSLQYPTPSDELFIPVDPFPSREEVLTWTKAVTDFYESLPAKLILTDTEGIQWVNLNLFDRAMNKSYKYTSTGISNGSQEIWLTAHGYFVSLDTFEIIRKQFTTEIFTEDFPQGLEVYQLYNREYAWSPGYQCIFHSSNFTAEIETGEKKKVKEIIEVPDYLSTQNGEFEIKFVKREIEKIIYENKISFVVTPAFSHLRWEEEYDASQKDNISFDVPCKDIIDYLRLEQKEYDGYYYDPSGTLVCFDSSLSGDCDGLLIRIDYLEKFLAATGMRLFWLCNGEKQFFLERDQRWGEWNGFIYYEHGRIVGNLTCQEDTP